ncbi:MAG: type 4 pilus major pilin [Alphaproteobacteria bacterium]|nr:type 4 pilus major pilin [Alphaproteobacteria bacterium]
MFSPSCKKHHCSGLTLTEVSIVMMIMGVVLAGLWVAVDSVYRNQRISTTNKQLIEVVSNIRSLYGMSRSSLMGMSITGTSGATLFAQMGSFPKDMIDTSVTPVGVVHAWHGDVTLTSSHTDVDGDSFVLGLVGVPQAACADLLIRMTGGSRDSGLIKAGTTTAAQDTAQMPIGLTTAVGDCSGELNTLEFTFMLKP